MGKNFLEELEGSRKKVQDDQMKWEIEVGRPHKMIKYGHRGPNLALFFLRWGILFSSNEQSGKGIDSGENSISDNRV